MCRKIILFPEIIDEELDRLQIKTMIVLSLRLLRSDERWLPQRKALTTFTKGLPAFWARNQEIEIISAVARRRSEWKINWIDYYILN